MAGLIIFVVAIALVLGYLSTQDFRLTTDEQIDSPSASAVVAFYNQFGGILMNDLYHHTFELSAMDHMIQHCDLKAGLSLLEVGPGSGFMADRILQNVSGITYTGVDMSETMYNKASARLKPYFEQGVAEHHLVTNTFEFLLKEPAADRYIFTYVLDLLPPANIDNFVALLKGKMQSKPDSKICIVNLTYGVDPLSRIVTNIWQLLYKHLGGDAVGGCRPLKIQDYFKSSDGFNTEHLHTLVSTGLPSEVAIITLK